MSLIELEKYLEERDKKDPSRFINLKKILFKPIINHPAKFSDSIIEKISQVLLEDYQLTKESLILYDPFAGSGKIALLKDRFPNLFIICNELEPEYMNTKYDVDEWFFEDSAKFNLLPFKCDIICTSPTYGNRMADHHRAKDKSDRITYTHRLGHFLHEENTGKMHWGTTYKRKHYQVYKNCIENILKEKGLFILNISNFIKQSKEVDVTSWHLRTLLELGLVLLTQIEVKTNRMGKGANRDKRVDHESVLIFQKKG